MGREQRAERYWTCDKRGDCCRQPQKIVVTKSEAHAMICAADPSVTLEFGDWIDGRLVLKADPCPLLNADGLCSIYEARPYSCRRFVCLRDAGEPWINGPRGECVNLERRLASSQAAVTFYASQQRHAQAWAKAHGWTPASAT